MPRPPRRRLEQADQQTNSRAAFQDTDRQPQRGCDVQGVP